MIEKNESYKLSTAKKMIDRELKPDEIIKLNLRKKRPISLFERFT